MKTLICIDGQENALKAAKLAGEFACSESREATFLFVHRHRSHTRSDHMQQNASQVFAVLWRAIPEMEYLHEAEKVFIEAGRYPEHGDETGESQTALVQVSDGVFEEGKVQLRSDTRACVRVRQGIPQEEILEELHEGRYELAMLGAHRVAGCPWHEIEDGPLYIAEKAQCPVVVIGKEFREGQPLLVCIGEQDPPASTLDLVRVIATGMKSDIEVLTVLKTADPDFQFSKGISTMIDQWSKSSLRVIPRRLAGEPVDVILGMAPNYGLIVCAPGEKTKKGRLGKVTKSVLCSQFNLLVSR